MKILLNGYMELIPRSGKESWTGTRIFTKELVKYCHAHGHTFSGLILRAGIPDDSYTVKRYKDKNSAWLVAQLRLNPTLILHTGLSRLSELSKRPIEIITEIIKAEKPDVILLNGFMLTSWFMLKAAQKAGIPVVSSHHGIWTKEVAQIVNKYSPIMNPLARFMEKDLTKLSTAEIFLNDHTRRAYEKAVTKTNPSRRVIIPIKYDESFLNKRLPRPRNEQPIRIGFVGRWDPIKNIQAVYDLAAEARRQKKDWEFYSVTKIDDLKTLAPLRGKYEKLIRVIPGLSPKELKKFYADMDLMILPSRFDAAGIVVMEAAFQNRATLISLGVGWVEEYEKCGMKDWIDSFADPKKALAHIERLLGSDVPAAYISHIKKYHAPQRIIEAYFKVLRRAARSKASKN